MSLPPNTTLYIKNLNDKVKKEELRTQLYHLFTPYGKVISVVAQKGPKMRGQAFVVFKDLAGATTAMRSLDGEMFYEKQMHIEYAKTKSHATLKLEDPNFIPPQYLAVSNPNAVGIGSSKVTVSHAEEDSEKKRARDDEMMQEGSGKRRKEAGDEDDMEMDEDEGPSQPAVSTQPTSSLRCDNLPNEVTDDVLAVLFQQYPGFLSTHVSPVMGANKSKTAHVRYDSAEQASTAKEALDGFALKKGWVMRVSYA
ncbi:hypothetical protein FRC02_006929 [Tulasnella sp. 418]|nr:hypothetical protein FRC02_006929 [Tulasnella sp. 418]